MKIITVLALLCAASAVGSRPALKIDYDPLRISKESIEVKDLVVTDQTRSRQIPLRIYLPASQSPAPIVLFSHGLGGARTNNPYLGEHWAQRGYVVVFLQHDGSDESVWKGAALTQRMRAMQQAASLQNFMLRVEDVPAVLDRLARWNKEKAHFLAGRLNMQRIGMSGHSFGAVTTQAVSGQTFLLDKDFTDPRIKAAVLMSPSSPKRGGVAARSFGSVKIPWMLLTGTNDTSPIGDTDVPSRLAVFPALPPGGKYEMVLDKAEHSAFSDRRLPGDKETRNPNHHRAILAVTTAFWDAYLREDSEALKWLKSEKVRSILEKKDRWQAK